MWRIVNPLVIFLGASMSLASVDQSDCTIQLTNSLAALGAELVLDTTSLFESEYLPVFESDLEKMILAYYITANHYSCCNAFASSEAFYKASISDAYLGLVELGPEVTKEKVVKVITQNLNFTFGGKEPPPDLAYAERF